MRKKSYVTSLQDIGLNCPYPVEIAIGVWDTLLVDSR